MDTKLLLELIDRFDKGAVSELILTTGDMNLTLRKNTGSTPIVETIAAVGGTEKKASLVQTEHSEVEPVVKSGTVKEITSPLVATFYRSAGPDAPPFIEVGSTVKAGDILCILESMKMMNQLEAEFDCTIVKINVQGGELVEFGQILFEVQPL